MKYKFSAFLAQEAIDCFEKLDDIKFKDDAIKIAKEIKQVFENFNEQKWEEVKKQLQELISKSYQSREISAYLQALEECPDNLKAAISFSISWQDNEDKQFNIYSKYIEKLISIIC